MAGFWKMSRKCEIVNNGRHRVLLLVEFIDINQATGHVWKFVSSHVNQVHRCVDNFFNCHASRHERDGRGNFVNASLRRSNEARWRIDNRKWKKMRADVAIKLGRSAGRATTSDAMAAKSTLLLLLLLVGTLAVSFLSFSCPFLVTEFGIRPQVWRWWNRRRSSTRAAGRTAANAARPSCRRWRPWRLLSSAATCSKRWTHSAEFLFHSFIRPKKEVDSFVCLFWLFFARYATGH